MDKSKVCPNMTDMVWIVVWHGRTAVDMVAKVPSRRRQGLNRRINHWLFSMDKGKVGRNMTDKLWIGVWHGLTTVDRVP